jgi:hypothetical protein
MTGCTRGEVELRNTVSAYNKMLEEALAKPDSSVMSYFASPAENYRVDAYIMQMLQQKKVMLSTLKKIDFKKVELDKKNNKAIVATHEEWVFYYVDEKSRQPVTQEEKISYNNVYHLIMEQKHWVVDKIDGNEVKPDKP